jgi:hypothetical protein
VENIFKYPAHIASFLAGVIVALVVSGTYVIFVGASGQTAGSALQSSASFMAAVRDAHPSFVTLTNGLAAVLSAGFGSFLAAALASRQARLSEHRMTEGFWPAVRSVFRSLSHDTNAIRKKYLSLEPTGASEEERKQSLPLYHARCVRQFPNQIEASIDRLKGAVGPNTPLAVSHLVWSAIGALEDLSALARWVRTPPGPNRQLVNLPTKYEDVRAISGAEAFEAVYTLIFSELGEIDRLIMKVEYMSAQALKRHPLK